MSEEAKGLQEVDWRRCCSFLEIVRAFRMSIHPAKLVLCFLGLGASFFLGVLVDQVPGIGQTQLHGQSFFDNVYRVGTETLWKGTGDGWMLPYVGEGDWNGFLRFVMAPLSAAKEFLGLVYDYWTDWPVFALINTVLALAVWALVGGAVTRMAAVRFAREENVPLKQAVAFSCRKWPSLVTSPLIPFGVLVLIALGVGLLTGIPMMIPYLGEVVVSILFFLTLIMGLVLALVFVGGAFSLGLQWPTIAAEGSDSFDAISRSVAYISSRPWRYLGYTIFAAVYGCLTFIFVKFVVFLTLGLTHFSVSVFTWDHAGAGDKLPRIWAAPALNNPWPAAGGPAWASTDAFATVLIGLWVWILLGLMVAFLLSFCLTSQTIIYFLLRRVVDATDTEEVYMEEAEEEQLPVEHRVEAPEPAPEAEAAEAGTGEPAAPEAPPEPGEK